MSQKFLAREMMIYINYSARGGFRNKRVTTFVRKPTGETRTYE